MNTSCNVSQTVDDSRRLPENCNLKSIELKLEAIDHSDHGLKHVNNSFEVTSYSHPETPRIGANSDVSENINKNGLVTGMAEIRTSISKEFEATPSYSSNDCEQNFRYENEIDRYERIESIRVNSPSHRHRQGTGTNQNDEIKPSCDTFSQLVCTNLAYEALHLKHYAVNDRLTILNAPKLEDQDARMNLTGVVTSISNDYITYDVIDSDTLCASLPSRVQSSISSEEFNAICRFVGDSSSATVSATSITAEEPTGHRSSTSVASFRCDTCPREFLTEKYLHMHKSLHITPGKTIFSSSSSSGGSEADSATILASVHRRHSTDADDQLLQLPPAAKLLKLDFNGTQWSCNICKKTFAQNSNYKNHVRTHSNERPFICDVCSIGFKERYHLKKHILFKHTDEMKEECRVCGKRFKDSTAVRAHERIHSDARPYGCRRCGKTFKTSECLWHHENRSRTCGTTLDGASQLVCQVQAAKHGVQRQAGGKLELPEVFGTGYSRGRGGGGGRTLGQNPRIFTPAGGRDNLIDGMSPITTHIKMEELDPPTGSCDDFSENYLNSLSMSSGLAFYEFRDIDAPPPMMTSSDMTPHGDYDDSGPAAKRSAVSDDRKIRRELASPQSSSITTRKLIKSNVSLSSALINDSALNVPPNKNDAANLSYNGSCSTNLDFAVTEEALETEHDKIMRFISEYDGGNRSANDSSKRISDGGTAASLSPPTAAVFPNWQQHRNPNLREPAKSVTSEDHRFCYGNLSNLPTAVVAPIQREASLASSCSASAPAVSSCTDSIPLAVNSATLNTNLEQKNALPPFETFAPIMRSVANVNQVGYRLQNIPPPLQQPTRYRQPVAQPVKPRLQMTSMLSVARPEFIYSQRQPLHLAMVPKCEPSAADECPTLQKYLLNNNVSGYQQNNSTHSTVCTYLPVQGSNLQQLPILKLRSAVAATEVTHFNGYPINSAKVNPSTYLYSDPQWGRYQGPEVEDMKVNCGAIYGATNEIWYVDNADHHLIQKVYATNLPGEATAQVYAMNLSGAAVISPIGNEIGRRNQMI